MPDQQTLLILGDSLVEWGDWETLLPDRTVINRGSAGEHVEDLAARLASEIDTAPQADHILILAGTNNLLMGNTFFPAIFSSMLPRLSCLCPGADITVNSIMPMVLPGLPTSAIEEINASMREVSHNSNCHFLDMTLPFTEHCLPITRPCFLTDGVHLSTLGYQVWAREITSHLQKLS